MATPTPAIQVTVDTFQIARRFEVQKQRQLQGWRRRPSTIPVTVDTFHIARGSKGPKVTTVTGMASTQPPPKKKKKQVTKEKKHVKKIKLHPLRFRPKRSYIALMEHPVQLARVEFSWWESFGSQGHTAAFPATQNQEKKKTWELQADEGHAWGVCWQQLRRSQTCCSPLLWCSSLWSRGQFSASIRFPTATSYVTWRQRACSHPPQV